MGRFLLCYDQRSLTLKIPLGRPCIQRLLGIHWCSPQCSVLARNRVRLTFMQYIRFTDQSIRDTTLSFKNFEEEIKQWTAVFGLSQTPTSNLTNNPQTGYSRASFGPHIQAILALGVGHTVPEHATDVLTWFNILPGGPPAPIAPGGGNTGTTTTTATTTTTTSSSVASSPTPPSGGTAAHWAQCAGEGYTGPTGKSSSYKPIF